MVWGYFMANAWRVKTAGLGGVTGFDLDLAKKHLLLAGVDDVIADELLAASEAGALMALNEKDDADDGQD